MIAPARGYTPTPALSHAILTYNRGRTSGLADGIVITPSHNPPEDGGFKYNPPHGGPAGTDVTGFDRDTRERAAHRRVDGGEADPLRARRSGPRRRASFDFLGAYVADLGAVLDTDAMRASGLKVGVDPLGGAGVHYWPAIAERYGLNLTITNASVDPTFRFMDVDWDGRIRMDPSSPYAMHSLVALKDRFDIAVACDTDHDRHGIVSPSVGLLQPNHYLTACDPLPVLAPAGVEHEAGGREDDRVEQHDRPRGPGARPRSLRGAGRVQVVRRRPAATAAWDSSARKAPARPSCAATAPSGRPTRTASSRRCSPAR